MRSRLLYRQVTHERRVSSLKTIIAGLTALALASPSLAYAQETPGPARRGNARTLAAKTPV